jgi:hypothetical protein
LYRALEIRAAGRSLGRTQGTGGFRFGFTTISTDIRFRACLLICESPLLVALVEVKGVIAQVDGVLTSVGVSDSPGLLVIAEAGVVSG